MWKQLETSQQKKWIPVPSRIRDPERLSVETRKDRAEIAIAVRHDQWVRNSRYYINPQQNSVRS